MTSTDVFVIGGGPAGLAAAIAARQRGFSVTVADGAQPPIDKACGGGFLPDGLAALERLGIQLPLSETWTVRGIRFESDDLSAEASFPGGSSGVAVRRTCLHRVMMERAAQQGACLLWGTAVTGISAAGVRPTGVHLGGEFFRARWIIGADGSNSRVRRWAGLEQGLRPRLRYAFQRHFRVAPWSDQMEVYWGERCQGYAVGVSEDQVCVALASHDPQLRLEDGLGTVPSLREKLCGADAVSTERGALTGNRTFHRIWRGNVALIGDASGTVDAITGEGMGLAFNQAVVLAECLESGDLRRYQKEHRRLARRPRCMARLMLTLDGRPNLQQRTVRVFRNRPEIFRRLLQLHVGALSPLRLVGDGLTLGWGLLTA